MKEIWDEKLGDYVVVACQTPWVVKSVRATPDYKLHIIFKSGEKKIVDMKPLLEDRMFKPLKDIAFFLKAYADGTTVAWSEDIDIAPEYLYEEGMPA